MSTSSATRTGRPRDAAIDVAVLAATRRQLAESGLAALSVSAIAQEAGTTRPAIYRRWPTRLELAVAAVANLAEIAPPVPTDDPLADLTAELTHFRHCITDAGALALAGVMLQDGVDPELQRHYRERLVRPRRARLRACLERGITAGRLSADADLAVAVSLATGSWYAYALGGTSAPGDWPERVTRLVWLACGGVELTSPAAARVSE